MPIDLYDGQTPALDSPAVILEPVTKDDDTDLASGLTRGLLVGIAGTANLVDGSGAIRTNVPLQVGYNPVRVSRVRLGGTADDIWALY